MGRIDNKLFCSILVLIPLLMTTACSTIEARNLEPTGIINVPTDTPTQEVELPVPSFTPEPYPARTVVYSRPTSRPTSDPITAPTSYPYPAPIERPLFPILTPTAIPPSSTPTIAPPCLVVPGRTMSWKLADKVGYCEVEIDFAGSGYGYSVIFPIVWTVSAAGVSQTNLMFNRDVPSGLNQQVFLQYARSGFPLEESDQVVTSYEMAKDPIVSPLEQIQSKNIITIKDKQVFKVSARLDDLWVVHYFIKFNEYDLFMVQVSTPLTDIDSKNYKVLTSNIEDLISSIVFIAPKP